MDVFINEMSFSGQCQSHCASSQISSLLSLIKQVEEKSNNVKIYFSSNLFYRELVIGQNLNTTIKSNLNLNRLFIEYRKKFISWNDAPQQSSSHSYLYNNIDYSASSVAEAAERSIAKSESIILNIDDSEFSSPSVRITKSTPIDINIFSFHDISSFDEYLKSSGIVDEKYDYKSLIPPMDFQTVLSDNTKFTKTTYRNQGRILYIRCGFDEYWCVDNLHTTNAHLEVFDLKTKKHLGTSKINAACVIAGTQIKNRSL